MNVPLEAYQPFLFEESKAIAIMERQDEFVALPIITPQSVTAQHGYLVSITNVHMVPGETSPRLRKVEERNPGVSNDIAADAIDHCVHYIRSTQPVIHHNHMLTMARAVVEACEEMDSQADSILSPPFRTIAVLSTFVTDEGEPFVTEHGSRSFFEDLSERVPELDVDLSEPEAIPDEAYRLMYAMQSEHHELPPYDKWKQKGIDLLAEPDIPELPTSLGYTAHLLLPRFFTHPTVNKLLFQ